jgi:hypothetical protein
MEDRVRSVHFFFFKYKVSKEISCRTLYHRNKNVMQGACDCIYRVLFTSRPQPMYVPLSVSLSSFSMTSTLSRSYEKKIHRKLHDGGMLV